MHPLAYAGAELGQTIVALLDAEPVEEGVVHVGQVRFFDHVYGDFADALAEKGLVWIVIGVSGRIDRKIVAVGFCHREFRGVFCG